MVLELVKFKKLSEDKKKLTRFLNEYLYRIKKIAEKYNLEIYLTGSRVSGKHLEGSDYDIIVLVPDEFWDSWLKIKRELTSAVEENSYIEFHVYKKSWKDIVKTFYEKIKKL